MENRVYSAYNLARGVLLNSNLALADSGNQPLKLLDIVISGMGMDSTAGLWLTPLHAIPAVPRVFPFDLVYLDREYRVIETAEMGPGIDFPAFRGEVASALVLPSHVLQSTGTGPGDRFIVCLAKDLEMLLAASSGSESALIPAPQNPHPSAPPAANRRAARVDVPVPDPISDRDSLAQEGPSPAVTAAVLDRSQKTDAVMVGHHLDPEDLFSNWVVSQPAPPSPPATRDLPKPPKQKTKPPEGSPIQLKAAVTTAQPKAPSVATPPHPASLAESALPTQPPRTIPQPLPATTFTAGGYGLWQVSMPTAIQPVTTALNAQSPVKPSIQSSTEDNRPASSAADGAPSASSRNSERTGRASAGSPASAPRNRIEPAPPVLQPSQTERVFPPERKGTSRQTASESAPVVVSRNAPQIDVVPKPSETSDNTPIASASLTTKSAPKPRTALITPAPKADTPATSLKTRFKQWLNPVAAPTDRRRDLRRYVPGMVAHYFTGGAPRGHEIADISMTGMYILTEDRWMPGTMIQMTLQKPCARGERKQSMNVLSRIVRRGSDGVAIEFVMPEALSHIGHDIQPSQATDKFALARFL